MTDQITVRHDLGTRVGRLAAESLVEVERALMAFLGLARREPRGQLHHICSCHG